jgi:hypothetical protein
LLVGSGIGVRVGRGDAVRTGVGVAVGDAVGEGVAGVSVAVATGVGVGVGLGRLTSGCSRPESPSVTRAVVMTATSTAATPAMTAVLMGTTSKA